VNKSALQAFKVFILFVMRRLLLSSLLLE